MSTTLLLSVSGLFIAQLTSICSLPFTIKHGFSAYGLEYGRPTVYRLLNFLSWLELWICAKYESEHTKRRFDYKKQNSKKTVIELQVRSVSSTPTSDTVFPWNYGPRFLSIPFVLRPPLSQEYSFLWTKYTGIRSERFVQYMSHLWSSLTNHTLYIIHHTIYTLLLVENTKYCIVFSLTPRKFLTQSYKAVFMRKYGNHNFIFGIKWVWNSKFSRWNNCICEIQT